VICDSDADV